MLPSKHEFEMRPSKDASSFAVNPATHNLWFLRPDHFTTADGDGTVLFTAEMRQKMERKGINNRLLRELGCSASGSRQSGRAPRNSDLALLPMAEGAAVAAERSCRLHRTGVRQPGTRSGWIRVPSSFGTQNQAS